MLKTAFVALSLKIGQAVLAFAAAAFAARLLGVEVYGMYAFLVALVSIVALPVYAGVPEYIVRKTASLRALQKHEEISGLWRTAFSNSIAIYAFLAIFGCVANYITKFADWSLIALSAVALCAIALASVRSACVRGMRFVIAGQVSEQLLAPLALLIGFVLLSYSETTPSLLGAYSVYVASVCASFLGATLAFNYYCGEVWKSKKAYFYSRREMVFGALPHMGIAALQVLILNVPILYLGFFASAQEVGYLKVAMQVSLAITFIFRSFDRTIQPRISHLHTLGDRSGLQREVALSASVTAVLSLPIYMTLIFFGEDLLRLSFGSDYVVAQESMLIIATAVMLRVLFGPVLQMLNMTGGARVTAILGVLALSLLMLMLLCAPKLDVKAASISIFCSNVFYYLSAWVYCVRRYDGVDPSLLGALKYFISAKTRA